MTSLVNMAFANVVSTLSLLSDIKSLLFRKLNNFHFPPKQVRYAEKKLSCLKNFSSKQIIRLIILIYLSHKASDGLKIVCCHQFPNHKGNFFLEKKYQKNLN